MKLWFTKKLNISCARLRVEAIVISSRKGPFCVHSVSYLLQKLDDENICERIKTVAMILNYVTQTCKLEKTKASELVERQLKRTMVGQQPLICLYTGLVPLEKYQLPPQPKP